MPQVNYAPTKTNLLRLRSDLSFAQQGYELLDQKRNILIIELLAMVDQAADCLSRQLRPPGARAAVTSRHAPAISPLATVAVDALQVAAEGHFEAPRERDALGDESLVERTQERSVVRKR